MSWRVLAGCGVAATLLCACGSIESPSTAVKKWASSSEFGQGVADMIMDSSNVRAAIADHRSTKAIYTYCSYLFADGEGENTDQMPTPDSQLTTLWSNALDGYIHAASICDDAPSSPATQRQVLADDRGAFGALTTAVLREEAITGVSLGVTGIP